ncbi:MAG: type II toxin-antitoxin system RelE/ParE family toxin [Actinomycetia bacterium]|nr:type II toxin-antitoxin system RelE/ParE family toxin [Actinomycetes bacterium]
MTYDVRLEASAARALTKAPATMRRRLVGVIELLSIDPRPPGAVMLRGGGRGRWRIRVGGYRVVYTIEDGELVVLVLRLAHRREVYRG